MMSDALRDALREQFADAVRFDVGLARLTSLRVGGPADAVVTPADRAQLAALLRLCRAQRVAHHLIGAGFNTLALDAGVPGIVIQLGRLRRLEERPAGTLRAEVGVSHSQITRFCTERGLAGLEFAAGIPGTVGGWLAMNAGIPDREMKDVVQELEVMSPSGRHIRHLDRAALHFVYRGLRGLAPGSVLLSALFRVSLAEPARVRAEVERVLARRAETQPLDVPSCGSVFKNPPGDFAGRLIEAAGLKGHRHGGAQISPVHANFIANTGGATASDVLALIGEARRRVREQTGARLVPEVRIL
ncbi:MAG: UDP-N-acetylmuramate dehydrogenase, partial [Myxococcales bacterium]|nr:UDP-N-acetylmuramate dehydrogenase [Myxococcales bacterium]